MEVLRSSGKWVGLYQTTRRHIPEDSAARSHLCDSLKCNTWRKFRFISTESALLYDWWFTANQFVLATSSLRLTTSFIFFPHQLNTCGYSSYVTSSLTRERLCRLQLLLGLASAVIFGSESRGTQWPHFTASDSRLPQPGRPGPCIYIPQERSGPVISPRHSLAWNGWNLNLRTFTNDLNIT
jgi:hypothetical protein